MKSDALIAESLRNVGIKSFENLCFVFPQYDLDDHHHAAEIEAASEVGFHGLFEGRLVLVMAGNILRTVAANMLGDNKLTRKQQLDALGEITNVICGNLLPEIFDSHETFEIDAPNILDLPLVRTNHGDTATSVSLAIENGRVDLILYLISPNRVTESEHS